ncbi:MULTISPECIES: type II toxin-antitoxin system RatA family toxin [unclassified Thalassotalea]|uniref:type II toxin-antitoxin system RatA family toxin n=1 Tax=unclassified Thalassotalea TaxID=2614972 RepID=UPI00107FFEBC|nr:MULTISPECIES: type II toxin-antitoxin system RatA family toxin [unclassified Thalassotalea]NMP14834.1 type II toxin-antitoxin system RatA family toxin [Thalassotalea sp. Y01]QBY03397.1 type II toxin-antitoxin system RatA family toxin [Thalassotalea sp. HSM 43]
MPAINRSALVMRSAADMYKLINDVCKYPEFLPGCTDAKIVSHNEDSMTASLKVSKGGVQKWFTTENTLQENQKVSMHLKDGPFKYLTGHWLLTPLSDDACKIELKLDYEFSSKLIEMAFGRIFDSLTNSMVSAFTQRAKQVY